MYKVGSKFQNYSIDPSTFHSQLFSILDFVLHVAVFRILNEPNVLNGRRLEFFQCLKLPQELFRRILVQAPNRWFDPKTENIVISTIYKRVLRLKLKLLKTFISTVELQAVDCLG